MLLGGHDTTSSTVSVSTHLDFNLVQSVDIVFQYCFLLLSQILRFVNGLEKSMIKYSTPI